MVRFFAAVAMCFSATSAFSQSLTPEEIAAMVEEKVNAPNPYAELLNNPDQERALAAMQIMFDSGDTALVDMALEFGLLSVNPSVRRAAFESYLASGPVLRFRFDGTEVEDADFAARFNSSDALLTPERIAYQRLGVGEYNASKNCFTRGVDEECFISVTGEGILWKWEGWGEGRLAMGETGELQGTSRLSRVTEVVPTSIRLLD